MTAVEFAWAAGIIEGEGSFHLYRSVVAGREYKYPRIQVVMTDEDVMLRLASVLGGKITGPYRYDSHRKPFWRWCPSKQARSAGLMMMLWPLLGVRRRERIEEILLEWRAG